MRLYSLEYQARYPGFSSLLEDCLGEERTSELSRRTERVERIMVLRTAGATGDHSDTRTIFIHRLTCWLLFSYQ